MQDSEMLSLLRESSFWAQVADEASSNKLFDEAYR